MENKYKGAFATSTPNTDVYDMHIQEGITKREYFAGLAMQGLTSNSDWAKTSGDDWDDYKKRLASGAVEIADELLKQLEQQP